jgi:hypothetical protein
MPNQNLQNYLDKRVSQPTVILCFKVLLDNVIINGLEARMTKAEINRAFDKEHKNFGVQTFRSDYLLRQSGENPDNAIGVEGDGNKFYIRPTFLNGLSPKDLQLTIEKINRQFLEVTAKQKVLYDEISKAGNLSIEKRKEFITFMLLKKETDRKGQSFEVTAFAILKTFYSIRGFELNRFSTIYSNDGGIDYTSQTSIYQVTTKLSDKKFEHVTKVQSEGKPFTDLEPPYSKFGMGFQLDSPARGYLTQSSFGHDGAGGQCAFADPEHKIGFAFVTTEMRGGDVEDDRATRLIGDLRSIL